MRELILVLGGARAGKSSYAERLAAEGKRVLFVATAEGRDAEMARRIAAHRKGRPKEWETLEEPVRLAEQIAAKALGHDVIVVDCLTLWVSNILMQNPRSRSFEALMGRQTEALLQVYRESDARWVVVSNEVGLGLVPPARLSRTYRDALGRVNQLFAAEAGKVYLMVAGIPVDVKALGR